MAISGTIKLILYLFSVAYFYLLFQHFQIDPDLRKSILINAALSLAAFFVTVEIIPFVSRHLPRRRRRSRAHGFKSFGIAVGMVFLVFSILFQQFNSTADPNWPGYHNAALCSIFFVLLLGILDDARNLPWRVKLILQTVAVSPLVMAYAGRTTIKFTRPHFGILDFDLGWIYKLFIGLWAVLFTNSLNVDVAFNGLEVGWTVVTASAVIIHNIVHIGVSENFDHKMGHAFSIYLAQPLLATSLALLACNRYSSSGYIGNAYASFAGITVAALGILGRFSDMVWFFVCPQLAMLSLGLIPRPPINDLKTEFRRIPIEKPIFHHPIYLALGCCITLVLRYSLFLTPYS